MSLPLPFPGETLFGLVTRIILRSGVKSANDIVKCLGSLDRARIWSPFGVRIQELFRAFPQLMEAVSPTQFVWQHTISPLLIAFDGRYDSDGEREAFAAAVAEYGGWGGGPRCSTILKPAGLRDCLDCIEQDVHQLGVPYWHREHQIRPVVRCWRHGVVLREHRLPLVGGFKFELPGYGQYGAGACTSKLPAMRDVSLEVAIARIYAALLERRADSVKSFQLRANLVKAGRAHGIVTHLGRSHSRVCDLVHRSFDGEFLEFLGIPAVFTPDVSRRISRPLRANNAKDRSAIDPVIAVLLAGALGLTSESLCRQEVRSEEVVPAIEIPSVKPTLPDEELERVLRVSGYILDRAKKSLAITRHQLIKRIEQAGIECPIVTGPNARLRPEILREMMDALRRGEPRNMVKRRFGVGDAILDQLRIYDRGLRAEMKRHRYEDALQRNRERLQRLLAEHPEIPRSKVQRVIGGPISFLRRHDRDWLSDHLPAIAKRNSGPPSTAGRGRVDDAALDASIFSKVQNAVARVRALEPPPKLTRNLVWRAAAIPNSMFRRLLAGRLPRTASLLAVECDSGEQFATRRIAFALNRLKGQRSSLTLVALRLASGLTEATLVSHREIVLRLAAELGLPLSSRASRKLTADPPGSAGRAANF